MGGIIFAIMNQNLPLNIKFCQNMSMHIGHRCLVISLYTCIYVSVNYFYFLHLMQNYLTGILLKKWHDINRIMGLRPRQGNLRLVFRLFSFMRGLPSIRLK